MFSVLCVSVWVFSCVARCEGGRFMRERERKKGVNWECAHLVDFCVGLYVISYLICRLLLLLSGLYCRVVD